MHRDPDLLIVGAGPAGLALGAAAKTHGLRVLVVDPRPDRPWTNNYGVWLDELDALGLGGVLRRSWPQSRVCLDADRSVLLPRAYGQVDADALRARLACPIRQGEAMALEANAVRLADGTVLNAKVVVDASGHGSPFVRRRGGRSPGVQRAWGATLRVDGHPWPLDEMRLMDFTAAPGAEGDPSFLYVMPYGPDRVFVEETSLVGRPPVAFEVLEARLQARLHGLGVEVRAVGEVERCHIPMGVPLPDLDQPVLAFGGAASMVHPATGYMLTSVLRQAEVVATALAAEPTAAAGWAALWPRERRRVWTILTYGMEVLLTLDQAQIQRFFAGFFEADDWAAFLAGTQRVPELTATMRQVFARVPLGLKARLMGGGLTGPGLKMFSALAGYA